MVVPLFWIYVVVELAAVVGLATTIGIGWTLLILLAAFVVGLSVAGSRIRRQLRRLRDGMTTAQGAVSDGALVALGTLLVVIPGLVTSVLGLLVLLPPTRVAARPVLTFLVARSVRRRVFPGYAGRADYIDGEVINVEVPREREVPPVGPPALP